MARLLRPVLTIVTTFALGTVFGPVLIAGAASLHQPEMHFGDETEASRLIKVYRANLKPYLVFTTIIGPDDGAECGYDPQVLFPDGIMEMAEARSEKRYSDYEGYYALDQWAKQQEDESWIAAITERIDQTMSPRKTEFLRRCIESTLFSDTCMAQVEVYGDRIERFPDEPRTQYHLAGGHEKEVICSYLDGVALKRGIEIPAR